MNEHELFTKSALCDEIRKCWKNKNIPGYYTGDYYYEIINQGILFNKVIEIPLEHFDNDLKDKLNKSNSNDIEYVIFRALAEIGQEKFGSRKFTDRIKWKFV